MTTGLYMIIKDEVELAVEKVKAADPYFDFIYLTISDKDAFKAIQDNLSEYPRAKVDYREWNGRFDDARNHNFAQGKTDLAFWLDADDEFDFSALTFMVKQIENGYDAVWLPYEYAYDDEGRCIALHWRERLVRRDRGFAWKGWVHETLITDYPVKSKRMNIPVKHIHSDKEASTGRNHDILLQAYRATKDPRYIHYLGISFYSMEEWEKCIEILKEYVAVGGWDEEIYRSLLRMSEASNNLGRNEDALQYATRAMALLPEYPQAYFNLAQLEFESDNYKQALEWLKVAFAKPEPETAAITDPTIKDRAMLMGAISEYKTGNNREAAELIKKVTFTATAELQEEFEKQASIDRLAAILPALIKHYEKPEVLWEYLPPELRYDNRLRKVRERLTKPYKWPARSVAIFCGKGYEEWGAHTLDKGMGGSEEAVVYLSRQLAKKGYDVTVYGDVPHPYKDNAEKGVFGNQVQWLPWNYVDKRDTFNRLIVWRYPQFVPQFKAKKMFVDMHDLLPEKVVKPYKGVTYMFKSQFHKDHYPQVNNFKVIGNGIEKSQFKAGKKNPNSVVYPSAYYRGAECLLDMWPKIREQVPDATLDLYYGWQSWVAAEGEDTFYHRFNAKLDALKDQGVKEHGRISHEKLAEKLASAQVWAYPTQFEEIHCITALKAQEARCFPVVTNVAALSETVQSGVKIDSKRIYTDEYQQQKFIDEVVSALKEKKEGTPVEGCSWADVAKDWESTLDA